jgi:hypothetical protein
VLDCTIMYVLLLNATYQDLQAVRWLYKGSRNMLLLKLFNYLFNCNYSIKSRVRLYNYVCRNAECHIPRLTKIYFTGYIERLCLVPLYIALS